MFSSQYLHFTCYHYSEHVLTRVKKAYAIRGSSFRFKRTYSCSSQDLHRPKPQCFDVELSDLNIAEEDFIEVFGHQLKA